MKNKLEIVLFIISFLVMDATIATVKKNDNKELIVPREIRAVYLSYLEYENHFYGGSKSINQTLIDKMIDNLYNDHFNTIILHVSPFSDAIYESKLFPFSRVLTGEEGKNPGFDYLDYFIKKSHLKNIQVYAWINPYRISFSENKDLINEKNPAYQLFDTSSVFRNKQGIYYNPASEIVKNLIVRQVEEIIKKYDVDGIHLDDYFYIQDDIDNNEYQEYLKKEEISKKEFRLQNTNDLIKRIYHTIKEYNPKLMFSIAPDGNINNNYLYHYADVKTWLSSTEYVDIIMPQIYYGFNNEYSPFIKVLENWEKLVVNKDIQIIPVLAIYKSGQKDLDAGSGINEWINNSNIISREVKILKEHNLNSYALFRYDFMYDEKTMTNQNVKEMANLEKNM